MTLQLYWPITKIDSDQRLVYGYASTEATDSQGEIVTKEALEAALPAYMRFANIREMHLPSAVGVAREAAVDDKGLYLKAEIVDDDAWRKVREGVYKGFSIGGAVTGRHADNPKIVTGCDLTEISLVDRPANPEAVFALWKSAEDGGALLKSARARLAQKWVASDGRAFDRADEAARHQRALDGGLAKATFAPADEATSGLTAYDLDGAEPAGEGDWGDPGYQPDGKKRYPLDTEERIRAAWGYIHHTANQKPYTAEQVARIKARIVAAWKAKIDRDGPPASRDLVQTHLGKAQDPDAIQAIHDHAVELGAHCAMRASRQRQDGGGGGERRWRATRRSRTGWARRCRFLARCASSSPRSRRSPRCRRPRASSPSTRAPMSPANWSASPSSRRP